MDIETLASAYRDAEIAHTVSLKRVEAARLALEATTQEVNEATIQVGTTLTAVSDAKAALIAAALGDVVPS